MLPTHELRSMGGWGGSQSARTEHRDREVVPFPHAVFLMSNQKGVVALIGLSDGVRALASSKNSEFSDLRGKGVNSLQHSD